MKISIVTITYGDGAKLDRALRSVYEQVLTPGDEVEHIIVNSNKSLPPALEAASHRKDIKIINTPPHGVYAALNTGLAAADSDIVGLLHGSDYYPDNTILATVADTFRNGNTDFVYGNIDYVRGISAVRTSGSYKADNFHPEHLYYGYAPPHTSLFVSKKVKEALGRYKEDYRIAADFDYFVRLFLHPAGFKGSFIPKALVNMDDNGMSRTLYSRLFTNTVEKRRALRENGIKSSWGKLMRRYFLHFKHQNQ